MIEWLAAKATDLPSKIKQNRLINGDSFENAIVRHQGVKNGDISPPPLSRASAGDTSKYSFGSKTLHGMPHNRLSTTSLAAGNRSSVSCAIIEHVSMARL